MTTTKVTDRGGKTIDVVEFEGRKYPTFEVESLRNCANFKARPDDIVLCTYPKSGTHWAYEIMRFLLAGSTDLPLGEKDDVMMEDKPPSVFDNLPSPRNINTHFHFEKMSPDFFRHGCKIVHVTRDPRDVAVSYFHHHSKLTDYYNYHGEWKDYFHLYVEGTVDYESWFEYTKGWEKGMKEHPDHPFLVLAYEAMKENPLTEVTRIANFLGTKHSQDFLKEIVQKTDIEAMKKAREGAPENSETRIMYRKGKSGGWKNQFTVAQSEYFNQVFEKEMAGTDAYKLYSHTVQRQTDPNMNSV